MYQQAKKLPQSKEAAALSTLADRVMRELYQALTSDDEKWATYWAQLLNDISSPSHHLAVWATLPQLLAQLSYTKTYQSWWQLSGKKLTEELYQIVSNNGTRPETPQITDALRVWSRKAISYIGLAWGHKRDTETAFWLDILQTIQPPTEGSQDWNQLLNDLDKMLGGNLPVRWCEWDTYKTLLAIWYVVLSPKKQHLLPTEWLNLTWDTLPRLLKIANVPHEWKTYAIKKRILEFHGQAPEKLPSYVSKCAPLAYDAFVELIQNDGHRDQGVMFCEFLLQQGYTQRNDLLTSILPVLLPYQDQITRIAEAAKLSPEELNMFMEETFYKTLKSRQDIPNWLLPHLESYLVNFQLQTLNPDRQEITPEKRYMISNILDILVSRNTMLPEQLRPYVFCWLAIRDFFVQPIFHPGKFQVIRKHINTLVLSKKMQRDLHQEIISFASKHVESDLDITRVIDNLGETLIKNQQDPLLPDALLLKELVHSFCKMSHHSYNQPKTSLYTRVVLAETITLEKLGVEQAIQEQFVNECLDRLFSDKNQLRGIQTTQWSPAIIRLWESYKVRRTTAKPTGRTKAAEPASSAVQNYPGSGNNSVYDPRYSSSPSFSGSNQQPIVLSDPSQIKSPRPQGNTPDPSMNNSNQPSTQITGKQKFSLNPFKKSKSIEEELQEFQQAFNSQRADKIAAAYSESIDGRLTYEQRTVAIMAKQLMEAYNAYEEDKSREKFEKLQKGYNTILSSNYSYILKYPEMMEIVERINQRGYQQ
jgi:hypothetical protein